MHEFEAGLYDLSHLFLFPVQLLIAASLAYASVALGMFLVELFQRARDSYRPMLAITPAVQSPDLELRIMKKLEWLRIVSRTSPMLGLVATMIPMGPALLALGEGRAAAVGENLVVAFSAVILALVSASITYFILIIRRRWLLEELRAAERSGSQP